MKLCIICGNEFEPINSLYKSCSKKCSHELRLQSKRRSWDRIGKFTDDKYKRIIKQRMRRIEKRIRSKYEHV